MPNHFQIEPGWRPLLKDLGISDADVLRRAKLPGDLLSRPDSRLSTSEYFRFWSALEVEANDPAFPVRIVEAFTAETFAPAVFAALCSPNLTLAIERLSTYKRLVAPMILDVERGADALSATFRWLDAQEPPRGLVGMEAVFLVRLARMGTREEVRPLRVETPYVLPNTDVLVRYLGIEVDRGEHLRVRFSNVDAERPFLTANDAMWRVFEPELRRRLSELEENATMGERVRAALLELLPSGRVSIGDVAAQLAMSRRTLQRRLKSEGTSYQGVLGGTREQLARHYLGNTALSCTEISFLLGFEEPNSFFRAFQGWTGDSPEHLRRVLRDGATR
ncbi:MAG: AraC family transcriptional regulator ligand-binding domain-containing protein [Myxococcota bacterium]